MAIVGRNVDRLNSVAKEIHRICGEEPLKIVADVNHDTERIIDETIERFGQLDVLINSAGICEQQIAFVDIDMDSLDRFWNTNVRSVVNLTKSAVPHLERTRGNVVNISSVAGMGPASGLLSYCLSKSALDQFTKCAALELAPKRIRVNSVNPGLIDTPLFETIGMDKSTVEQFFAIAKDHYPLGRIGKVSDTSSAIAYLASDSAEYLTGVLLPVDGGKMIAST